MNHYENRYKKKNYYMTTHYRFSRTVKINIKPLKHIAIGNVRVF